MTRDWEDRDRSSRGYGRRDDYGRRDRRDWGDKAGDEVRSWFGDDDAERRRSMDEDRDYDRSGSMRDRGRYADERGYGGRSGSASESNASRRSGYGRQRDEDYSRGDHAGRGDFYDPISAGMAGWGTGMMGPSYYGSDRDYSSRRYSRGDYGRDDERGFLDRAGDEVASWFGDEDAQRRREKDAGHRGRGPKNYSRSDDRVREDVSDRLSDDRHIDASDIEVSVSGGEVTLDGTVESRWAKRHAEDLADSCSGVSHVQNNLRVKDRGASTGMSGSRSSMGGSSGMAAQARIAAWAAGQAAPAPGQARRSPDHRHGRRPGSGGGFPCDCLSMAPPASAWPAQSRPPAAR